MMSTLASVQSLVLTVLMIAIFVFSVVAFIDSLRYSGEVYRAADKKSKGLWCGILGAAALVSFVGMPPMNAMPMFLSLLAVVAAAVYFVDVRKALRSVDPRYRNR
ncbi:DUF2516 family protein [Brevibacterium samyangense]|uniref:DUF2516 family protein n=1 Tax=Brevibacterium samyangense TaxID=366888 RepID=A0ABP5F131_9MICO